MIRMRSPIVECDLPAMQCLLITAPASEFRAVAVTMYL